MNIPGRTLAVSAGVMLSVLLAASCSGDPERDDPTVSPTVVGTIDIETQNPDESNPAISPTASPSPAASPTPGGDGRAQEEELPHELFEETFSQEYISGVCDDVTAWFASAGSSSLSEWKDRGISSRYVTSFYLEAYDSVAFSALQEEEWGERDYEVIAEPMPSTGTAFCAIYRPSFRGDYEAVFFTYTLVDEESQVLEPAIMRYEQSVSIEQLRLEATRSLAR